jgi:hypothetical protein
LKWGVLLAFPGEAEHWMSSYGTTPLAYQKASHMKAFIRSTGGLQWRKKTMGLKYRIARVSRNVETSPHRYNADGRRWERRR